jgi:hypothetical protein
MTSTTSRIISDVANHYNRLIVNHRKLDKEIKEAHEHYQSDQVIKSLKLNKLHLKQQIEDIKTNLQTIIEQ